MRRALPVLAVLIVAAAAEAAPLEVWVSIQPQLFVVERLGGELVEADVLVAPGQSPHTYEPSPKQMAGLADADLLVTLGVPFEHALLGRLRRVAPELVVLDGRRGVALRTFAGAAATVGDDHGHHHGPGAADPHFWLDPTLLTAHAETVAAALAARLPDHRVTIDARLADLRRELEATDRAVARILAPHAGGSFIAYHPSFAYLARRYNLEVVVVEREGKEPGARELAELTDIARRRGLTTVFAQPQFSQRNAHALAAGLGGRVVALDPLAGDYCANLERMAAAIAGSWS